MTLKIDSLNQCCDGLQIRAREIGEDAADIRML